MSKQRRLPRNTAAPRAKLYVELLSARTSNNMTRTYMAMKQSKMLGVDRTEIKS